MTAYLLLALLFAACEGGVVPEPVTPDPDPEPEPVKERALVAPEGLTLTGQGEAIVLAWKDCSTLEEGYVVDRSLAGQSGTAQFLLPANSQTWTDEAPPAGMLTYTVRSYWHMERSEPATVSISRLGQPVFETASLQVSAHMAALGLRLMDDGGAEVRMGVEYGGKMQEFPAKVAVGSTAYLLLEDLEPSLDYSVRPWARNAAGTVYGQAASVRLSQAPAPLTLDWEDAVIGGLPDGLSILRSSTDVPGHHVNLWCAVADMTAGTMELRTTKAYTATEPGEYIRGTLASDNVCVLVNGGYFASPSSSYSYVCDRGTKLASNVSVLSRKDSYNVTRGFFGIDRDGRTAVGWIQGDSPYAAPLPVYDGGPSLSIGQNLPVIEGWAPWSAIGGGPVLLRDGRMCLDFLKSDAGTYLSNHELFQTDIYADGLRAPRTAIGTDGKGKIVLLVADGRGSGGSTGLTLDELARIMAGLGCTDVLNLDGGGSSAFLTGNEGTLHNSPSDGKERKVLTYVWLSAR